MEEVEVFISMAPSSFNSLSFFPFSSSFLPPFLSSHKYLLSTYYAPSLVLGSVAIIMNKTVYIILTTEETNIIQEDGQMCVCLHIV